jgi:HEAT repeat protein
VKAFDDEELSVRYEAAKALKQIDAQAAAKAGVR